ncbi:TrkA family potassium uptake protein [bacterium 1xD42-67]|nr:TrkA family potassium uptake protein [bacterium 1xD42-67]
MRTVLLIGLGRFGRHVAQKLSDLGHQVMAVDSDEERVDAILPIVTNAQIGDSTDRGFLSSLGVRDFDVCIVAIGDDFQNSLETTDLLKELGARKVIARASRGVQEKFLRRCGADEVVYPEKQLAVWTAIRCTSEHILDYIELDQDHSIFELSVPERWAGRSILQLDLRKKYGINVLGIRRAGKLDMGVGPDTVLDREGSVLVLGRQEMIRKFV